MKFLRLICNFLLFFAMVMTITIVQIGIYDITAAQSNNVDGIHLISPNDKSVAYFDTYAFWAEDIGENFKQPTKYRIRNWGSANWWKKGTKWADIAIDAVISVVKPVVVPIAQINAVKVYYGQTINSFDDYYLTYVYESEEAYNNALYECYVIFEQGYGDAMTVGENPVSIFEFMGYTGGYQGDGNEMDYARWVGENTRLYNNVWKLSKYNSPTYDKYFTKFIEVEGDVRYIKAAAVVLYYQQYVSFILATLFIIKYPVNLSQFSYEGKDPIKKKRKNRN